MARQSREQWRPEWAIDGKQSNAAHKTYHVMSAWVTENELTLGEIAVEEKSNKIMAIPELLGLIDIEDDVGQY